MNGNYNNNNYNNISYNNPINLSVQEEEQAVQVSDAIDEMDEVSAYIEIIKENIEYEHLIDAKKVLLQNFPYLLFAYFFNKMAWLYRISTKEEAFDKVFDMINRFDQAFTNPLPSFHVQDILIGVAGGIAFKLIVYYKAKNAKKFRYGREYGSARRGNAKDMEPYVDPVFENNVILTETERLMMSGRPKEPKYARNKNILVIGGSGSGKDCRHKPMDDPYRWSSTTLGYIIHRQEYLGHTVLKKSKSLSYKSKKRVKVADEDKMIFRNTHEAIVDEETWKIANRVKAYRKKTPYSVDPLNLTGILYCADCGAKLTRRIYNHRDGESADSDYSYCCSKYRQITSDCTMHFIKRSDILELIKKSIQRISKYTITNEKEFREQILAELEIRQEADFSRNAEVIANAEARMKELDTLIGKLYETYAMEKISDRQYQRLMNQYEEEYGELEVLVEELAPDEEEQTPKSAMDSFIALAKKYADFEELTPTMIHEFIDKIVVHESNGVRGFGRKQKIEIYFNFIGQFIPPYSTAELKAEAMEQAVKKAEKDRIRAEKRAETVKRYKANKAKKLEQLKADAEAGEPKAIAEYEGYCRNEEKKREQSKAYFKERYRREQEKYKATKALAEQGDSQAVELLMEYDRRIEHKKQVASEREKAKRRTKRKVS